MICHTGIGTYVRGLLEVWKDKPRHEMPLLFGDPELTRQKAPGYETVSFRAPIYGLQEQLLYPRMLKQCRLWHAPHYNVPLIKPAGTKLVVTIHDLIHWIYRGRFFSPLQGAYAAFMLRRAVQSADHIMTVSSHTRDDLIKHFSARPGAVSVIHEAVSDFFQPVQDSRAVLELRQKYHLPPRYFLYVGSLKPHKNVQWLLKIFRQLHSNRKLENGLVLVGRKDRKYPQGYEELAGLQDGEGVFHRSGMNEEELRLLYNGATALIHPSLYEGFGLTLLEAMACGTPVVALKVASIPEVAGSAACLLESGDEKALSQSLLRLEGDTSFREDLSRRGLEHAKKFSWQKTAAETEKVYRSVLGGQSMLMQGNHP